VTNFFSLAASGNPVPVPPVTEQTVYCTGGRVRWTLSPGSATEPTTNTVAGTRDGLVTTYDQAAGIADAGLAYSVGYAVSTPAIVPGNVKLRLFCNGTGSEPQFFLLSAAYDNTVIAGSTEMVPATWTWYEFDIGEDDPATGLPWTAAGVGSKLWGFSFDSDVASGITEFRCAEIELLIEL